ncbi:uncharacterized protein LOC132903002 [Amyelois transitella]|uniref:uncharacterized protein LOC132903002 n=1 Tax=Amyelois transitella TaxID=680683 RepID=UPI00298F4749|nr:uncharacterized protein LOC132903002 [Amyelois transitella]
MINEVHLTNTKIESSVTFLSAQNEAVLNKVQQLEVDAKKDREYITMLENKLEESQMLSRKTNIEIRNVPKQAGETKDVLVGMQKNKLTAKHLGLHTKEDTPIFVTEHLTPKGSRLYFLARELVKSRRFKYCWTAYGKIYLRKDDTSPIILIKSEAQIQKLGLES